MLFPLDVGTSFCFVNTRPIETMWSSQNWKSALRSCARPHNHLCETHFTLTLCVSYSTLMLTITDLFHHKPIHLHTCLLTHAHTAVDQREWLSTLSWNCIEKGEVANLTSLLSLLILICLGLSFFFLTTVTSLSLHIFFLASLYSCFTAPQPFSHILHHLFPLLLSATHPLFALLSHSTPCHSPLFSLSLFF